VADAEDGWLKEHLDRGDVRGAVDRVYRLHARDLRGFLRGEMHSEEAVEDVLSELFSVLMKDLADFRGDAKLRTWLRAVTRNLMLRHFQREQKARERQRPLTPADDQHPTPQPVRATLKQYLVQLYNRLDDGERQLVDLWAEGWSWLEIAERTGTPGEVSEEAVRKRFTRLMNRLNQE
jgi:RNA polymerase sigma-70 factor (ECF subfamily)